MKFPFLFRKKKEDSGTVSQTEQTPIYTIFAGINGSGKTSLYNVLSAEEDLGVRVNIDEIAMSMGSWRDTLIQIKAGRSAVSIINKCIAEKRSFHQETTLPGATIVKHIKAAKDAGFRIVLYYVGIDSLEEAIERVHTRVRRGGHGIDDEIIRKRFEGIAGRLREILPYCDRVTFFDNTARFRQLAIMENGELIDCDGDLPTWFGTLGIDIDKICNAKEESTVLPDTDGEYFIDDIEK